jgi:hypothetical protein
MSGMRPHTVILALISAAGAAASFAPSARADITFRAIALTGTDGPLGPGEGSLTYFYNFGGQAPTINASGQAAFRAQHNTAGNPQGVWLYSGGVNTVKAIAGGAMPGGGDYPFGGMIFNSTYVNNAGQMAWRLGASTGLFADLGSGPQRVMLNGDSAPDSVISGPSAVYYQSAVGMPLFNQNGQNIFLAQLSGDSTLNPPVVINSVAPGNCMGLWAGTPGNMHLVLRQDDPLLFLDNTGNTHMGFMSSSLANMAYNDNGAFVAETSLQGNNVFTSGALANSSAVLTNRSGTLATIARAGDVAPDATGALGGSDLFKAFIGAQGPAFNNRGHVAFNATLRDSTGALTNNGVLFTDVGTGVLRQFARSGQPMPTVYDASNNALAEFNGVTWGINFFHPVINTNDVLVVDCGGLGNTGSNGLNTEALLMLDATGRLHKIMRGGDVAIPGGAPFGGDAYFVTPQGTIQLNSAGQVVFLANLTGTNVNATVGNNLGIFAYNLDGSLTLLARTGDSFQVAPGDLRTITANGIGTQGASGGEDGHLCGFNASGDFVFELDFADSTSGIFIAHIPLPHSCYANCDGSTTAPILNVIDFTCFLQKFAAADPYANCDASTTPPVLNVIDFTCFLQKFAAGCP